MDLQTQSAIANRVHNVLQWGGFIHDIIGLRVTKEDLGQSRAYRTHEEQLYTALELGCR